jgi:sialidase-1
MKYIEFLKRYIILVLAFVSLQANAQKTNDGTRFTSLFNSSMKNGVACYRIPAIVTATNGDLIAAIDERVPSCGDLKWSPDINIVIRRSSDNGQNWTEMQTVVDYAFGQSASDPSMIVDQATGNIFLFYNYMNHQTEKNVYYLKYIKSPDHGKTWEQPVDITAMVTKPEWRNDFKFITSGRGIQTSSGKLVHTLVNLDRGVFVIGSDDNGKNWYMLPEAIKPADESQIIELDDKTWMINSRVNGAGNRFVHISDNEGKTWKTRADSLLPDPGCNAGLLRISSKREGGDKNRLLFSNIESKNNREKLVVSLSYDEGKTWPVKKTIYEGKAAYSSLTRMDNGNIGLFFEKDDYTDNVFTTFSIHWLTDGNDSMAPPKQKKRKNRKLR